MQNRTFGIGIDSVDIARFNEWHTYPCQSLRRIYSDQEIDYCLEFPAKSAERFAARFAVREAFLKALHQAMPTLKTPLLTICKAIVINKTDNGAPQIRIDWNLLGLSEYRCHASWTHTKAVATAIVLIDS